MLPLIVIPCNLRVLLISARVIASIACFDMLTHFGALRSTSSVCAWGHMVAQV
jgi:hypothetical protein